MTYPRLLGLLASVGIWAILFTTELDAATNALPGGPRVGARTNLLSKLPAFGGKTNMVFPLQGTRAGTNASPASPASTNRVSNLVDTIRRWQGSPTFYPALVGVSICLALVFLVRARRA